MPYRFSLRLALFVALAHCFVPSVVYSANRVWTAAASGDFGDPANWSGGVPGSNDSATFSDASNYTVTFDKTPNTLANPVQNQDLFVTAGNVTFVSGSDGTYTYHLTGAGGDDVNLTGGSLTLGTVGNPLHLTADDDIIVRGNSLLNVNVGSQVNAVDLLLGTVMSGGNGTVSVNGSNGASALNVSGDTIVGRNESDGTLTYRDGAQGSLSALGTVSVGVDSSTFGGTQGALNVQLSADLVIGNLLIGTGSTGVGTVTVRDSGSTVLHTGSSSLAIGSAGNFGGGAGTLFIMNSAIYAGGTGTTTIRGQGLLQLDAGTFTTSGPVNVNTSGDPGPNARLDLNSQGTFVQNGSVGITVGAGTGGVSTISLDSSSATFTTGTGQLTINKTGVVDLNGGTFNANGDVVINGGFLDRSSNTMFGLAPGKELTIQNGGRALFSGTYTPSSNSTVQVVGGGSRLETGFGQIFIDNGAAVHVSSGGAILNSTVNIGGVGVGTLRVDGPGSLLTSSSTTTWGSSGGTADVAFSNNAMGTLTGPLNLAMSLAAGTTAIVSVESGADLALGSVTIATQGGTTTSAILNISDTGSSVTITSSSQLTVGHNSTGIAVINLVDGGALTLGTGSTTLNTTGRININGGHADLKTLNQNGGKINLNAGSLSYIGNLTIGAGGLLGTDLTLDATKSLALSGTTTVNAGSLLLINEGGNLNTGSLNNNGEFRVNGLTSTIAANSINNSGMIRGHGRISANVINATSGDVRVGAGQQLRFSGTSFANSGDVVVLGTVGNPAELTIDGAASNAASTGLIVGRDSILQFDAGLNNAGSLALNLGTNDVFGDINNTGNIVVTGGANATFYDDVAQNGSLTVSKVGSTTSVAVFFGDFTGSGGSSGGGDIFFEGDLRPGASPAEVTYQNNIYFGGGANLQIELGGLVSGTEHDKIVVAGALEVAGTLDVSLINGFTPTAGDSFDILDWTSLNGTFNTLMLPTLSGALAWDTSQLYTSGELLVSAVVLVGDFNVDNVVDAADYVVWRASAALQTDYETWHGNFGRTVAGGGSGSVDVLSSHSVVPEPASFHLLFAGALLFMASARRGCRIGRGVEPS